MTLLKVFGVLALVCAAAGFTLWVTWREAWKAGYAAKASDMAELRAQRRAEARQLERAGKGVRTDAWPEAWEERLASTGELAAAAETGDIAELERSNAAFMRVFDLWQWTARKRSAA